MMSGDPTPRLFAAAASLLGTGILMCRAEPSWDGILIGLLCLGLWALGTLAARPLPLTEPVRARAAVVVETPRARPELLPAPRPTGLLPAPAGGSGPPAVPTQQAFGQQGFGRRTRRRR